MNTFEERYFPLKRAFLRRSKRYSPCRIPQAVHCRKRGDLLTLFKLVIPAAAPECRGKKIAFVSDWHWHASPRQQRLLAEFKAAMSEFNADILLLGGDLCDDAEYLDRLPELLAGLSSTSPEVYAVNGNWETGKRWLDKDFFRRAYAGHQIKLLSNESIISGGFRITGLPDISSLDFKNLPALPESDGKMDILLAHSPDGVIAIDHKNFLQGISLAFCGHTHGGQIRIPGIGAVYCPSFYRCKFAGGIFARKDSDFKMIVSRGIGEHKHTFRLFCPPEAVMVEFI